MRTASDADDVGIARDDIDAVWRYEEKVTDDLRETGLMTLTTRLRADDDINVPVGRHRNLSAFLGSADRGFYIIREAQTEQLAVLRGLQATRLETTPVGDAHGEVHVGLIAAAVVGCADRVGVGHFVFAHEVLAAQ